MEKFPYAIECVQTDNGFEFANEMGSSKKKLPTLFEKTLEQLGIRHKKIRPFTPRHNGNSIIPLESKPPVEPVV